jgi:hypothetical protein
LNELTLEKYGFIVMKLLKFLPFLLLASLSACFQNDFVPPPNAPVINKAPVLPVLETGEPSIRSNGSIRIVGQVYDVGQKPILEHGHTWSTDGSQVGLNYITTFGERVVQGSFVTEINDPEKGETYYIQAYAISVVGTVYGEVETISID